MSSPDLVAAARAVLDGNWLGAATKPGPHLYPHQWSWDSAFIAIGNRHQRWDRAVVELETLFAAQWSNGLVPHIVFSQVLDDYFPSPGFWASQQCEGAPTDVATSGIVQTPVHAMAAWRVYQTRPDTEGLAFLHRIFEPLVAWHRYLLDHRRDESGLLEIWHPWESGMDNSPIWDEPLARMEFGPDEVPPYRRIDTSHAVPEDRPTDRQYDEYAFLVGRLRREAYTPTDVEALPFRVQDALFNCAFAAASRDLARIAEVVGADTAPMRGWAAEVVAGVESMLWSEGHGMHLDRDARTGTLIESRSSGGLMGLLIEDLAPDRRARLLETIERSFLTPVGEGSIVPSVPVGDPGFVSTKYWRGPAWIHMNWLLSDAARRLGVDDLADQLETGITWLVATTGFWEYYDVTDLTGHGSDDFSWTAALVTDVVLA